MKSLTVSLFISLVIFFNSGCINDNLSDDLQLSGGLKNKGEDGSYFKITVNNNVLEYNGMILHYWVGDNMDLNNPPKNLSPDVIDDRSTDWRNLLLPEGMNSLSEDNVVSELNFYNFRIINRNVITYKDWPLYFFIGDNNSDDNSPCIDGYAMEQFTKDTPVNDDTDTIIKVENKCQDDNS